MANHARIAIQLLIVLCVAHLTVDVLATTTVSLLPSMEEHLGLEKGGFLIGYIIWRVADSCGQMCFGYLGDRMRFKAIIWAGPLFSLFCFSFIGYVNSPVGMTLLLMCGGMGVAAFHPEAATTAGNLSPKNRNRWLALFALSGYLGQAVGPAYGGSISDWFGLQGLTNNFYWCLPALMVVGICLHWLSSKQEHALQQSGSSEEKETDRSHRPAPVSQMILLFVGGVFRVMPALGIPIVMSYILILESDAIKGTVASYFMAGLGIGGIACAFGIGSKRQRLTLWLPALLTTLPVAMIGYSSIEPWFHLFGKLPVAELFVLALISGILQGVAMPIFISYAQQIMPAGQRFASSLTMGVTWGTGTLVFYGAMAFFNWLDYLKGIFWFFAAGCIVCAICSYLLRPISDYALAAETEDDSIVPSTK